jgi:CoA:oxalate CoA-transferase
MDIFRRLVKTADIVLENFRPGTMEKMGLSYADLCELKADIIMLRVSAFGQYGPYKDKTGFDPIGQALSGLMTLTGQTEGKPIATAFSLVDRTTALHCTIGALGALRHRDQTGEGQVVDVCLMDSGLTMVEIPTAYYLSTGEEGGETGRVPFRAKDGWVVMAGISEIRNLLLDIGVDPDEENPDASYPLSILNRTSPIHAKLNAWCEERTVAEVCEILESYGAIVAPVRSTPEVAKDPHLWEREMFVQVANPYGGEVFVPGLSIKFSKTPGEVRPLALPGQHTDEILAEVLELDQSEIDRLRERRVI